MASAPKHRARACPRDHTPLVHRTVEVLGPDVTVDDCPKCHGVFLDKNELARVTGDKRLNKYLRDEVHLDSDSDIICPHCGGMMDEEEVLDVTVDVCLTCFGIWLDKGELEHLDARDNKAEVVRAADKADEAMTAANARARALDQRSGRGALSGAKRGFARLDDFLSEIVRRHL